MKLAVYLSAVPRTTKNQFKRDMLAKFAQGIKSSGDEVQIVDDVRSIVSADIAVLQGWVGMKTAPHLDQRRRVIEHQRSHRGHTLVIDSNLFGFLEPTDFNRYLRYSLDGIFPTTGYYFTKDIDGNRWSEIKRSYGFQERAWNLDGKNVLVCLQRDGGWSMDGLGIVPWLGSLIPRIQKATKRPILIRPHPGSLATIPEIKKRWPNIEISHSTDIRQDLDQAWCTVTYNSSPGVASLLWGVPTFVTDPDHGRSQAHGFACADLSCIDDPLRPERDLFYHRLAQCHFATATLADGHAWRFMRSRLP